MTQPALTRDDVAELRALLEKATPGPWIVCGPCIMAGDGKRTVVSVPRSEHYSRPTKRGAVTRNVSSWRHSPEDDANARLIAAAPALASQFVDREPNPDLAAAIAKELRERGLVSGTAYLDVSERVGAPLIDVITAVLSVVAQREAEIRRAAIEECATAAAFETANDCESLGMMDPETGASECSLEVRGDSCLCAERYEEQARIVKRIRSLAQQPAKEPPK